MPGYTTIVVQGADAPSARDQLKLAIDGGLDGVLVVGGDGALHAVLDHVADSDLIFGLIPAGTGNDTARSLGIPVKDVDAAVDLVIAGNVRTIDLARTDEAYVATVVASGFDSKVNERARDDMAATQHALQHRHGRRAARVRAAAVHAGARWTSHRARGHARRRRQRPVVRRRPADLRGAKMDDGLLDAVVINPISKPKLLRVFPKLYKGTHITMPEFERHLVREVTLTSPGIVAYGDGERLGPLPMTTRICPGALRVFAPPAPA